VAQSGGDRFTPAEFALVTARLALKWSPEQIAAVLRQSGLLAISHETIYRYIWADKRRGGQLHTHLRGARSSVASATAATSGGAA